MILVTGGTGYIGSNFVRAYLQQNPKDQVVVIDDLSYGHKESLSNLNNIHLIQENMGNKNAMSKVFKQFSIEAVVHFAAFINVGESQENPDKYIENNLSNSLKLFEVMQDANVKKIVFSSSCAVYGTPKSNKSLNESHERNPINVYGKTKLKVEEALENYSRTNNWSYLALRYFNASGADKDGLYGESHNPETHLIPLILQTASGKREFIQINGDDYDTEDGTCVRDYIHIDDLANAHLLALEKVKKGNIAEGINLGTAHGASVKQIIDLCNKITGKQIKTKIGPRRSGDPAVLVADYKKAKDLLGWEPKHSLESIITSAWKWELNRRY